MSSSYTPKNADTVAIAQLMADYVAEVVATDTENPAITPALINDNYTKAFFDSLLQSIGFQAQQDVVSLTTVTTTSAAYVDIGDGLTTGFPQFSFTPPVTKTYLAVFDMDTRATGAVLSAQFQVVANGITYTPASVTADHPSGPSYVRTSFRVPVVLTAGSPNIVKVQWKRLSGSGTLTVDSTTGRTISIHG